MTAGANTCAVVGTKFGVTACGPAVTCTEGENTCSPVGTKVGPTCPVVRTCGAKTCSPLGTKLALTYRVGMTAGAKTCAVEATKVGLIAVGADASLSAVSHPMLNVVAAGVHVCVPEAPAVAWIAEACSASAAVRVASQRSVKATGGVTVVPLSLPYPPTSIAFVEAVVTPVTGKVADRFAAVLTVVSRTDAWTPE
jgi:hypothetical protein